MPKDSDILNALEQKLIDAGRLRAPWFQYAEKKGLGVESLQGNRFHAQDAGDHRGNFGEVPESQPQRDGEVPEGLCKRAQILRRLQKGQHIDEFKTFVKKYTDVPPDIAADLIQSRKWTDEIAVDDLIYTQKHFVLIGTQMQFIPLEKVLDLSYLKKAKMR